MWEDNKDIIGYLIGMVLSIVFIVGVFVLVTSTSSAPMGEYTLVYNGGPFDSREYRALQMPGEGFFYKGALSSTYHYPSTTRTYIISKNINEGDSKSIDSLTAKCGDSNEVNVECALTFQIDPQKVRKLHENYGIKFKAWTDEGWNNMLKQLIRQPIKESLQEELKPYTAISAQGNGMLVIAANSKETMQHQIDQYMGGHYFNIIDFQINDITPTNKAISDAIASRTAAQQGVETAKQQVLEANQKAKANKELANSLKAPGSYEAVLMEAVKSGKVKFWVLPGGNSNISINAEN